MSTLELTETKGEMDVGGKITTTLVTDIKSDYNSVTHKLLYLLYPNDPILSPLRAILSWLMLASIFVFATIITVNQYNNLILETLFVDEDVNTIDLDFLSKDAQKSAVESLISNKLFNSTYSVSVFNNTRINDFRTDNGFLYFSEDTYMFSFCHDFPSNGEWVDGQCYHSTGGQFNYAYVYGNTNPWKANNYYTYHCWFSSTNKYYVFLWKDSKVLWKECVSLGKYSFSNPTETFDEVRVPMVKPSVSVDGFSVERFYDMLCFVVITSEPYSFCVLKRDLVNPGVNCTIDNRLKMCSYSDVNLIVTCIFESNTCTYDIKKGFSAQIDNNFANLFTRTQMLRVSFLNYYGGPNVMVDFEGKVVTGFSFDLNVSLSKENLIGQAYRSRRRQDNEFLLYYFLNVVNYCPMFIGFILTINLFKQN